MVVGHPSCTVYRVADSDFRLGTDNSVFNPSSYGSELFIAYWWIKFCVVHCRKRRSNRAPTAQWCSLHHSHPESKSPVCIHFPTSKQTLLGNLSMAVIMYETKRIKVNQFESRKLTNLFTPLKIIGCWTHIRKAFLRIPRKSNRKLETSWISTLSWVANPHKLPKLWRSLQLLHNKLANSTTSKAL